jgi:hypothetical protein
MAIIEGGRVVLAGEPTQVLASVAGKIWRREMSREELDDVRVARQVISVRLVAGRPVVHVYAETQPDPRWGPVDPDLEDVYFHTLAGGAAGGGPADDRARAAALQPA